MFFLYYKLFVCKLKPITSILGNVGKPYVKKALGKVIKRADDMTEILSCYINRYGKPLPNSMKKGIDTLRQKVEGYYFN